MEAIELDEIFDEDGALSAQYLLARGYCCGLGCKNCPYEPRHGGADARPRGGEERTSAASEHNSEHDGDRG